MSESLVIWGTAALLVAVALIPYVRRFQKRATADRLRREEAVTLGFDRPATQHPLINETLCIGCGACVDACPEGDVLGVVSGRAVIINGLRCVGHSRCAEVCPVGAIEIGLGDISDRPDIPVLGTHNESSVPGLFIAGELSGFALIRNAVAQGREVMEEVARRIAATSTRGAAASADGQPIVDVIVVGAGPAGLSAALVARQHALSCLILDQDDPGGTILHYPRKKMVLTQPIEIPLYGKLPMEEYQKETLLDIWHDIIRRFELDLRTPERVGRISREDGGFALEASSGVFRSRYLVLATG
ncbi:MAG: NAD(P)-binding domain-containing protein, partial [Candidatus Eisenbacteria bacterium]|nr:NAD(P)-binding domain-containing protein [Candidatus Eisenbacteria bacterium]